MKIGLLLLLVLSPFVLRAEERVIVPQSELPLKKSYLFSDSSRRELILAYEKLTKPSSTLFVERRRVDDLKIVQRFSLSLAPGQTTRLADYAPSHSVLLIITQQNSTQQLSVLSVNVLNKATIRSSFFTLDDARKLGVAAQRLSVSGMIWDNRLDRESLLINASTEFGMVAFLASLEISGTRKETSVLRRREKHTDLALNSCSSSFAASTVKAVRILKGNRSRPFPTPEEITFDPDLCRFAMIRRQFNEIPQIYFLDALLNTQHVLTLPGGVAPGLIEDSRNQLVYSAERKSFFYPTVISHAKLSLNEITQNGVTSETISTSVDFSSISVSTIEGRAFLLISGLRVRTFEKIHQLILVSMPPTAFKN